MIELYDFHNKIQEKAEAIYENFPDLKDFLLSQEKQIWEAELLERKMQLCGVSTEKDLNKFLEPLKNNVFGAEINNCENKLKDQHFTQREYNLLNDKEKKEFKNITQSLPIQYQKILENNLPNYSKGLNIIRNIEGIKNIDTYDNITKIREKYLKGKGLTLDDYLISKITHMIRESDIMDIELRRINSEESRNNNPLITNAGEIKIKADGHIEDDFPIVHDDKANNSADNVINTIREFLKLKKKNPNLNRLIVVSEWPYLLRQVYTTIHQAKGNPEFKDKQDLLKDVEIIGYPADFESTFKLTTLLNEFYKIADYKDVGYGTESVTNANLQLNINSRFDSQSLSSYPSIILPDEKTEINMKDFIKRLLNTDHLETKRNSSPKSSSPSPDER